jgi:hypothetical protein
MENMVTSETSSARRWAWCHGSRGDAIALSHRAGLEQQDMWQHRNPYLLGAESGAVGLDLSLVHGIPHLYDTDRIYIFLIIKS